MAEIYRRDDPAALNGAAGSGRFLRFPADDWRGSVLRMKWLAGIALSLVLVGISTADAEPWPARAIRLVVPFAPAGVTDTLARIVATELSKALGQQVYVENVAGSGGTLGAAAVARAEPDGYNLVLSGIGSHVLAAIVGPTPYDPVGDFTHIAYLGGPPNVIIVHPSLGARNFAELLRQVRAASAPLGYASPGVGSFGELVLAHVGRRAGLRLEPVPYRGGRR